MSQSKGDELSQDVIFNLLSNPRRRFMLSYLRREGGPIDITELANEIAAWENETTVEDLTSQQRKRVYVSIYQTHIPKLEEAGVVEYDRDTGMVEPAARIDEINTYFRESDGPVPWQQLYLAAALLGATFYLAVALDVAAFAALSEYLAGLIVVVGFGVLAVAHYLYARYGEYGLLAELGERSPREE